MPLSDIDLVTIEVVDPASTLLLSLVVPLAILAAVMGSIMGGGFSLPFYFGD